MRTRIRTLAVCLLAYALSVLGASLLWEVPIALLGVYVAISIGLLSLWHTRLDLYVYFIALTLGALGEYFTVKSGAWHYSGHGSLLPLWLPFGWANAMLFLHRASSSLALQSINHAADKETRDKSAIPSAEARSPIEKAPSSSPAELEGGGHAGGVGGVREAELVLLKVKAEEVNVYAVNIVRTIGLFLAVTGGLLKFALDANSTESLRLALSIMGLTVSILLIFACALGERYRRSLIREINGLRCLLVGESSKERLTGIQNSIVATLPIAIVAAAAWLYLLAS